MNIFQRKLWIVPIAARAMGAAQYSSLHVWRTCQIGNRQPLLSDARMQAVIFSEDTVFAGVALKGGLMEDLNDNMTLYHQHLTTKEIAPDPKVKPAPEGENETGGEWYFQGLRAPVSFRHDLDEIQKMLGNQYLLTFQAKPCEKAGLQSVTLTTEAAGVEFASADSVWVAAAK